MGRIHAGIRLPMTPMEPRHREVVEAAMRRAGVLT
jgi:hypothetical protein